MKTEKNVAPERRILVTLAFYLCIILTALLLGITHQLAGWVAQTAIALALGRLVFLFGWGVARNGKGWRV